MVSFEFDDDEGMKIIHAECQKLTLCSKNVGKSLGEVYVQKDVTQ